MELMTADLKAEKMVDKMVLTTAENLVDKMALMTVALKVELMVD